MRIQALFLDQGEVSTDDRRRNLIVMGFIEHPVGVKASDGMREFYVQRFSDGTMRATLLGPDTLPEDAAYQGIDESSYHELLHAKMWARPEPKTHAPGLLAGRIAHRRTAIGRGRQVDSFMGILCAQQGDALPVNHRITFEGADLAVTEILAHEELRFCMGVYPEHYLGQPGWSFDGKDIGLASSLSLNVIRDLEAIARLEVSGAETDRLQRLRKKRDGILGCSRRDEQYQKFKPLFRDVCHKAGIDPADLTTPRTKDMMTAFDKAASEAIRTLVADR
jgi:hypothetical protein